MKLNKQLHPLSSLMKSMLSVRKDPQELEEEVMMKEITH
jgi:hypothetical protein